MIHTLGNVESFELCQISHKNQCPHCMKCLMEGILYCDCGTCFLPSEEARRLNKECYVFLTVPFFPITKGAPR